MLTLKYINDNKLIIDNSNIQSILINIVNQGPYEILSGHEHSVFKVNGTLEYTQSDGNINKVTTLNAIVHIYNNIVEVIN